MRIGSSIFLCAQTTKRNGVVNYSKPVEYRTRFGYITIYDKTGYMSTIKYGKKIDQMKQIVAQPQAQWKDVFTEGDLLYVDKIPTTAELNSSKAEGADYIVSGVSEQNRGIIITLTRRT